MSAIHEGMRIEDMAALVCSTLDRHGVRAVLSGGAVVTIYSNNAYQSKDLDFIVEGLAKKVDPAMLELGFGKTAGRYWTHPRSELWVEFPSGPLQVGDAHVTEYAELKTSYGVLRLLAPTECTMDRLAAYYHWNDPQGLDQAVEVAVRHDVDLNRIRSWSNAEGASEKFTDFTERLAERKSRK